MGNVITLIIFLLGQQASLASGLFRQRDLVFANCPGMNPSEVTLTQINMKDELFEKLSQRGDMESSALKIYSQYEKRCDDEKYLSAAREKINHYIKVGREKEVEILTSEIKRVSAFRSPSEEWENLKKISLKLKTDPHAFLDVETLRQAFDRGEQSQKEIQEQCTPVDNRKEPLSDKVRDQDGIGWCYAFTAADLLSHKYGKLVSAFDLAMSYNDNEYRALNNRVLFNQRESDLHGGHIDTTIAYSLERGFCLEKDIRSSDTAFAQTSHLRRNLINLENYKDAFDDFVRVEKKRWGRVSSTLAKKLAKRREQEREDKLREFIGDCSEIEGAGWRKLFPGMEINDIIEVLSRASRFEIISKMVLSGCREERIVIEDIEISKIVKKDIGPREFFNDIDKQLNEGNIVGIEYFTSILRDSKRPADDSSSHASSIVGRRFNKEKNSCEYLIRNSWGEGCSSYDESYECKKGQVWIPQQVIDKGVINATYLK